MFPKTLVCHWLLLAVGGCLAKPYGADEQACDDMLPSHGAAYVRHADKSPYLLTQDKLHYNENDSVVTVKLSTTSRPFKGYMIMGFDENEKVIGTFGNGEGYHAMCNQRAATQNDAENKTKAVVHWNAPRARSGFVHFRATIVETLGIMFLNFTSTLP